MARTFDEASLTGRRGGTANDDLSERFQECAPARPWRRWRCGWCAASFRLRPPSASSDQFLCLPSFENPHHPFLLCPSGHVRGPDVIRAVRSTRTVGVSRHDGPRRCSGFRRCIRRCRLLSRLGDCFRGNEPRPGGNFDFGLASRPSSCLALCPLRRFRQ